MKHLLVLTLILGFTISSHANERLKSRIEKLFPGCEIAESNTRDHFESCYEIKIDQLLDHNNPQAGTFKQRFYLFHADNKAPVHLETEGYWANAYTRETAKILKGNQVTVEYRFYGESKPDVIPWKYLTNDQAIEDLHRIVVSLKNIYSGPWISSGISKGGETTIIYKHHYPNDCAAYIAYVAPIILDREDPRTEQHLKTIGSDSCRKALHEFQRRCLQRSDSMLTYLNTWAKKEKHSYTLATPLEALEYGVLEFTFSFWQWGGKCNEIPSENSTTRDHFNYVNALVGFDFYNDASFERFYPSYYQHELELGYYGFPTGHLDDLLKTVKDPDNMFFAPKDEKIVYNTEYMQPILEYVEGHGDKMIYIYGEYDTWSACAVHPSLLVDHLMMVLPGGSHTTRIADFPADQQQLIYDKLKEWLDVPVYPLEKKKK